MADKEKNEFVRQVADQKYEFGFTTNVHTDIIDKGLNEDVVRLISQKKGEPEWLLDFRLKAFRYWLTQPQPTWGHVHLPEIDYQAISYYADPLAKKPKDNKIDPELEKTFDKLGIPLEERLALSGTAVQKYTLFFSHSILHHYDTRNRHLSVTCLTSVFSLPYFPDFINRHRINCIFS